jgi:hypothetical protein
MMGFDCLHSCACQDDPAQPRLDGRGLLKAARCP